MSELDHVLIIGGGIGGLCLAQGLTRSGVSATVYERDCAITDRLQGYRVHISPKGSRALHDCLPPALFEVFATTCGRPPLFFRILTERMQTLISVCGFVEPDANAVEQNRSVSRITLRHVLLTRLAERVQFGKTFVHYEMHGDRVIAFFEDGSMPRAASWLLPMGAVRECAGSICRTPNGLTPVSLPLAARYSSARSAPAHSDTPARHSCAGFGARWARTFCRSAGDLSFAGEWHR